VLYARIFSTIVVNCGLFAAVLFPPAGTWHWLRGWVLVGTVFVASVASICGLIGQQGLLKERMKAPIQQGQPLADKIVTPLFVASFYGLIAFASADAGRWHWLPRPGTAVSIFGLALFVAAWVLVYLALKENAFAAPVVRHQEERGQTLVDTGVYGVVRHPMYAGALPLLFGLPLWLGSYSGVLAGLVPAGLLVGRLSIEEGMLRREIHGYEDYIQRVRYRLIPYVW
jgi:protein-S-isoprenylcysteine O-methyltransferase Ste14